MPELLARRLTIADDWTERLSGTELAGVGLTPQNAHVVVVEDEGRVKACWAAMYVMHLEGLWEAPDAGPGASRALLTEMINIVKEAGVAEVLTQSLTRDVDQLILKVGGRRIPGNAWVIPVAELAGVA
jgi:hypothetical protein